MLTLGQISSVLKDIRAAAEQIPGVTKVRCWLSGPHVISLTFEGPADPGMVFDWLNGYPPGAEHHARCYRPPGIDLRVWHAPGTPGPMRILTKTEAK